MRRLFKIIFIIIVIAIIILVSAKVYLHFQMKKSLPDYNEDIELKNLKGEVLVYRDAYAIPHIYASNETDMYRATGYLMSQDRLWQMDLLRRVTQGKLAEIFGDDLLDVDYLLRSLQINEKSQLILSKTRIGIIEALEAYADGINQYIEQNADKLPVEFKILGYKPEKWEPVHSINLISYMAWNLKAGWENLILDEIRKKLGDEKASELLPNITRQQDYVFSDYQTDQKPVLLSLIDLFSKFDDYNIEVFNASNNWCVTGSKTKTGSAILANDMHLGYNMPGTWYQVHQVVEGILNVSGLALPGAPVIVAGHNDFIAWGMTNTYVDNLDLYELKINPDNENQYELDGEWKELTRKNEVFRSKKGIDIIKEIRYDHRGPVISDFTKTSDKIISLCWTGMQYSNELEAVYKLNRAYNWNDFRDAVKGFTAISQNINYADVNGNIGLQCCAGIPVRNRSITTGILPGWTTDYDWTDMVPFGELPYQYNPEKNYVSSANNRTVDNSYPYYIGTWYGLPYRFQRINEVLDTSMHITIEQMEALQGDMKSMVAKKYLPVILDAVNENKDILTRQEMKCLELLRNWDLDLNVNSNAGMLFEKMYMYFITNLLKDEMGDKLYKEYSSKAFMLYYAFENAFNETGYSWIDNINTKDIEENLSDLIFKSFTDAISAVSAEQGSNPDSWNWGDSHVLVFEHPLGKAKIINWLLKLNSKPYHVGGSWHTVCPYAFSFEKPYNVVHGASHRHIFDLNNWDNSLTIMPTGNCANPVSMHYTDQSELYVKNEYHQEYFSKEKVVNNAMYSCKIKPGEKH